MTTSADFTINGSTVPQASGDAVETSSGGTVSLAVVDVSGANSIQWTVVGTSDPTVSAPSITTSGTPDGATATFTMPGPPNATEGSAVGLRCRTTDASGNTDDSFGVVGVVNNASRVPLCAGETTWRHVTHGWLPQINASLIATSSSGLTNPLTTNLDMSGYDVVDGTLQLVDYGNTAVRLGIKDNAVGGSGTPVFVRAGDGSSGGGSAYLDAGTSSGGAGGGTLIRAGQGTSGGSVTINSGDGSTGAAGNITLNLGSPSGVFNGGQFQLLGADSPGGQGSALIFNAGDGGGISGGGYLSLTAGDATGSSGTGGYLILQAGASSGGSSDGYIELKSKTAGGGSASALRVGTTTATAMAAGADGYVYTLDWSSQEIKATDPGTIIPRLAPVETTSPWVTVGTGTGYVTVDTYSPSLTDQHARLIDIHTYYAESGSPGTARVVKLTYLFSRDGATYQMARIPDYDVSDPSDNSDSGSVTVRVSESTGTLTVALGQDAATARVAKCEFFLGTDQTVP